MKKTIDVIGARVHNLKNINSSIPKNKLTVITGVSGSGKSSLAFDTIHSEGQRRYMESFSAYARQFIGNIERPDVDKIDGLSPVIAIEQKTTNKNPRSTVGTVTEIYDFMRLLFARIGEAYSYNTGKKMIRYSEEEIIKYLLKHFENKKGIILSPIVKGRKGHYRELFEKLRKQGFLRVRVDGELLELKPKMQVDRYKIHDIEIVIDRLKIDKENQYRLVESIQSALKHGNDQIMILEHTIDNQNENKPHLLSKHLMCEDTGISYDEPSPNSFSFNSPYGACPRCKGIGTVYQIDLNEVIPNKEISIADGGIAPLGLQRDTIVYKQVKAIAAKYKVDINKPVRLIDEKALNVLLWGSEDAKVDLEIDFESSHAAYSTKFEGIINMLVRWFHDTGSQHVKQWAERFMKECTCPLCEGTHLKKESLWFKIDNKNIAELSKLDLQSLQNWFQNIEKKLSPKQNIIAKEVLKEIRERLGFLLEVGLGYLSLDRTSKTLSGGESQRIRIATQIGSKLKGITYILDEPSIGLHQRDNERLIKALQSLRDIGNTIIVVEHDKDIMLAADYLIDIGPGAGKYGGEIINAGSLKEFLETETLTSKYLTQSKQKEGTIKRRNGNGFSLKLEGAQGNNLKNIQVEFPLGVFICVTGVSGSGKSTLINETLYPILSQHIYKSKTPPLPYHSISGLDHINKVIDVDQSPIGRTPRSNPATYCNIFNDIRQLYSTIPEAKIRGYKPGRFSFNVKGGRCEVCEGNGMKTIEMNFLPDVHVLCEKCNGKRFNQETLEIRYKGKSIADVLEMTVAEASDFFKHIPSIYRKIKTLVDVGLSYISLGQSALTLSGGEAQRIKLATELSKKDTGHTFYILDEPTTGLHFSDIEMLIQVLQKLVDRGNTVLVIEHNLDVIKVADYIIDIGVEGGQKGGTCVAKGTPEQIAASKKSLTGLFLKKELH
ncbi:MAG TPA: excinuclease ABC subunit UvrA [Chitinophagaceae bacterium]|nr:MAG: excinuclease ABC subunit A [Bacteroidetes bacterium OLB11]HMN33348.1 excinuclease ABC subunit UvrA [Chitinophagaceae bacterium]